MNESPRVWTKGANGLWSSREPNDADKKRHALYEQWKHKKMHLRDMAKALEEQSAAPEHYMP